MKRRTFLALGAAALIGFGFTGAESALAAQEGVSVYGRGGPGGRANDGTRAGGQVSAINGTTISVALPNGASKDILTTASTTFTVDGAAANLAAVKVGMYVHAQGTTDSAGAFTATSVTASTTQPTRPGRGEKPSDGTRAGGQVSAINGTTISVALPNGASKDILTTASTTFTVDGAAANLAAVKVGMYVHTQGITDSAGAFTATSVTASTTQPTRPGRGR